MERVKVCGTLDTSSILVGCTNKIKMDVQQELSRPNVNLKSSHELAAQVEGVYSTHLESLDPTATRLDEEYRKVRSSILALLEDGVSDEALKKELDRYYEQCNDLGIYSPLKGGKSEKMIAELETKYKKWGLSESEASEKANASLSKEGYLAEVRNVRRNFEKGINQNFSDFDVSHPLSIEEETQAISLLRDRCIFVYDPERTSRLLADFPGGNFLYHGTRVEQAISILNSGSLANSKKLWDDEEARVAKEGGERKTFRRNSGYEGISWNYNEIGALPGDRYHLVGFLACPSKILSEGVQLAIPSRPAPNELILINAGIDSNKFYSYKTQQELLMQVSLGESNSVWSSIAQLSLYREAKSSGKDNFLARDSLLQSFTDGNLSEEEMSKILRSKYSIRYGGTIQLSSDLLQQVNNEIPVAAVYIQALIDSGRIKNLPGFEDSVSVREVIKRITHDNYKVFLAEIKKEKKFLEDVVKTEEDKITSLAIPVSEMYFVVPNLDLNKWLRVLARCKVKPKGIIVYDHNAVRLENFASKHKGDDEAMGKLLRDIIPVSQGYVNYEQILGEEITPEKKVGSKKHVIGEQYLTKRKSLRKKSTGEMIIR